MMPILCSVRKAVGEGDALDTALDTLRELQKYITSEAAEADEIVRRVGVLEGITDGIGGDGEEATVVAYVQKAIAALKIGDYATVEALNAAIDRIKANEDAIAALGDMAAKDKVSESDFDDALVAKVEKWDAAEQNAKDYVDEELKAYSTTEQMNAAIKEVDDKFADYYKKTEVYTKTEVDAAIDADVLVETNRATEAEAALSGRIDTLETVVHSVEAIDEDDIKALFA